MIGGVSCHRGLRIFVWMPIGFRRIILFAKSVSKLTERDASVLLFNVLLVHALAQELYLLLGGVHSREYQDREYR